MAQIDTDIEGYPYMSGEIIALDLDPAGLERVRELGYLVVSVEALDGAGATLTILRGPASGRSVLDRLTEAAPQSTFALNHIFAQATGAGSTSPAPAHPAHGRPCECRVGMVDTGVNPARLPGWADRVTQRGFGGGEARPQSHGHGVASLLTEQMGGDHAPSPRSGLWVADVFSPGPQSGSAAALVSGLSWLSASGTPVVNMSLTGPPNAVVAKVISLLAARGVVIVAAAGNDGPAAPPAYPGAYPGVVAVTAVNADRRPYRYANRGAYVALAALGVDVSAGAPDGGVQVQSGTSFAAPVVAVEIARRISAPDAAAARRAVADVEAHAIDLGAPGRDPVFGYGLVEPRP